MKGALANGAHVGTAGCAVTQNRCIDAVTRAERAFAEVLAEVLRVDRLSVESHFFDELGADSLVMAKFCARVRKRGDLPWVSMKDIYGHPTIRNLAAALEDKAPASAKSAATGALEMPTPTSTRDPKASRCTCGWSFSARWPSSSCALYRSQGSGCSSVGGSLRRFVSGASHMSASGSSRP